MIKVNDSLENERERLKKDAEQIGTATDYTDSYIMHYNCCDSSDRAEIRMRFVREAEIEFINAYKKDILQNAKRRCLKFAGLPIE